MSGDKLSGLSLFTGIGGMELALSDYVHPVAYCEIDPKCQAVLEARMKDGNLPYAPIFGDVRCIQGDEFPEVDIIYGGFPCHDISCANTNARGLEGERSGLFFEIMRLADVVRPEWIFLENVPAVTLRGGARIVNEIAGRGYDARWDCFTACECGARHIRRRWFLLAHVHDIPGPQQRKQLEGGWNAEPAQESNGNGSKGGVAGASCRTARTGMAGSVHVVPSGLDIARTDRYRMLGNAVVPAQALLAFESLLGKS